jgi:hypothetical protein
MQLAAAKTWLDELMTAEFLRGNFVQMIDKAGYFEPEGGVTCHVIVTKTAGANAEISHHIFEKMTYAEAEEIWEQYKSHNTATSFESIKRLMIPVREDCAVDGSRPPNDRY